MSSCDPGRMDTCRDKLNMRARDDHQLIPHISHPCYSTHQIPRDMAIHLRVVIGYTAQCPGSYIANDWGRVDGVVMVTFIPELMTEKGVNDSAAGVADHISYLIGKKQCVVHRSPRTFRVTAYLVVLGRKRLRWHWSHDSRSARSLKVSYVTPTGRLGCKSTNFGG
jgi:hypothetical protein